MAAIIMLYNNSFYVKNAPAITRNSFLHIPTFRLHHSDVRLRHWKCVYQCLTIWKCYLFVLVVHSVENKSGMTNKYHDQAGVFWRKWFSSYVKIDPYDVALNCGYSGVGVVVISNQRGRQDEFFHSKNNI